MNNSSEEQGVNRSMPDYAEQSSALAHSMLVKLEGAKEIKINSKESLSLASDLSHIWASCKMMDNQHFYSHALTTMSILSKMMSVNSIITETES